MADYTHAHPRTQAAVRRAFGELSPLPTAFTDTADAARAIATASAAPSIAW